MIGSKSLSSPPDNTYPISDSHNSNTSNLKDIPLGVIHLNNLLSEASCVLKDNDIKIHLEKWSGRGNKELNKIPSVRHLEYDRFKQNVKQENLQNKL